MTTLAPERADAFDFELPDHRIAPGPAELRGTGRDDVALMVSDLPEGTVHHHRFAELPLMLRPGDVVVVNTSRTIPAALSARGPAGDLDLHLSTHLPADLWTVELRLRGPNASRPFLDAQAGWTLALEGGGTARLLAPHFGLRDRPRLWVARLDLPYAEDDYLAEHGRPITYCGRAWPLDAYQTIFATEPGSAEMPSAARPFSDALVTSLVAHGIELVPVLLHTGVSSPEVGEPPYEEYFRVEEAAARRINSARRAGGRVIATGTTVVRALESAADHEGGIHPAQGWTSAVITPKSGARSIDGLITGWHEPRSSHLAMLEAIAGRSALERAYRAALSGPYLWHEFGDLHLLLPPQSP